MNIWQQIQKAVRNDPDAIPEGFKTTSQWGKVFNKSESHTARIINKLKEMNLAETKTFRVQTSSAIRPIPHHYINPKVFKK
jgi:hypothetical protein